MACPSCGRPVPDGARFCPACGHGLALAVIEERRVVTVLFADLVGYTTLAEDRDPEQLKRMIDDCFAVLVADIEAYGGTIDKLLGDGLVALFGTPVAHEDDAERAVRAALRMQAHLVEPFRMRVGVNTGEVVVGTVAGTEKTVMGDVVNTAARLQTLAAPGAVLVGEATAALLSPAIIRDPYGETALRGRNRPESVWRIVGTVLPGPTESPADSLPFVGRVNHRAMLAAVTELVTAGRSAIVSVVGEPGIGKSRFVEEAIVAARTNKNIALRRGYCAPYDETNIWSPLARAAADAIDLDPDASAESVRKAAADHVVNVEPDEQARVAAVEALVHMLGHPSSLDRLDPQAARDEVVRNITEELRRHAVSRPVILWIDDVQWADPVLLEALRVAAQSLADLPLLIITAHRPERSVIWPPLLERALLLRLPIGPLSRESARSLTEQLLGEDVDDELADSLYDRSGGSPLFLTELGKMTAAHGEMASLPGSLRALIAARLDSLPPAQRAVIDNAAVLGVSGTNDGLARFALEMGQSFSGAELAELGAEGFLVFDGTRWRFRSDVVRDVAYQTLTKQVRAQRHAGVAMAMASTPRSPLDELAHHLATAAEIVKELGPVPMVTPRIGAKALSALTEASRRALESGSFAHAERQATRALALGGADPSDERTVLLLRATAYAETHRFPEAHADVTAVLDGALAASDVGQEAKARRLLGTIAQQRRDLGDARRELERAVELFRGLGDDDELAQTLLARGFAEVFGGSLDDAERVLGEADRIYASLDDERGGAWVRQHLAWVSFLRGDHAEADRRLVSASETFESLGDRSGVAWATGLLAWVRYFQRRFDDAERLAEQVRADVRSWGDRWAVMMMQTLLANIRLWSGRVAESEEPALQALAGFRKLNDPYGTIQALAPLSRIRVALGKTADAERSIEEALAMAEKMGDGGLALQVAVGVAMHVGDPYRGLSHAEDALEQRYAAGADADELLVMRSLVLCQAGRADEALAVVEGLDVDELPFGRAVRSLARALTGDTAAAGADATAVAGLPSPSYFDSFVAALAALSSVVAADDVDAVERQLVWLEDLGSRTGDVVVAGVARYARLRVDGEPGVEGGRQAVTIGDGWRAVVDAIAPLADRPTATV